MVVVLLVEKTGDLKEVNIKGVASTELYKKCGFKKPEEFQKQHEWSCKVDGQKYFITLYAKLNGRANTENKYDFPPPVDTALFFGTCALFAQIKKDDGVGFERVNLTTALWKTIYEKLFGGFEDLCANGDDDENEEDELENIDKSKKTKNGYLKDGFVVDSDDDDDDLEDEHDSDDDSDLDEDNNKENDSSDAEDNNLIIEDLALGQELEEEAYDYSGLAATKK
jgi:hypothetical protein